MASTYYYDPDQVNIVVANIPIDSGFAEDEMCTFEREGDDFLDVAGVLGDVARSKNLDNRGTFTLKLLQTSPLNGALSALRLIDRGGHNGAGVGAFLVQDKGGLTKLASEVCWIAAPPKIVFGKTAVTYEWKIRCANCFIFAGGN